MKISRTLASAFVVSAAMLSSSLVANAGPPSDPNASNNNSSGSSYGADNGQDNHSPILGSPLFAVLKGHNVCRTSAGAGVICAGGDPNGIGSATFLLAHERGKKDWICFGLTATAIDTPTSADIHRGREGVNGPLEVRLAPPKDPYNGNPGASSGCVEISAKLALAIHDNPVDYYVIVHTARRNGDIRGQLR